MTDVALVADFLSKVQAVHKTGVATEHSYRPALEALFNALEDGVVALNEPKRVKCGAPDFIVQRGGIVVGHAEAKDIGIDLRAMKDANEDQQQRYLKALPNLIYTNCLDWDFYRAGERVASVAIADRLMGIRPRPDEFPVLENLLREFVAQKPQTITSSRTLAEMMAGKAALIKDVLFKVLREDGGLLSDLGGQYEAFREHLIHDITPEDFADIYAETIAYGMFAARLHDVTLESFSRQEALELLPRTNPFLRSLFGYIAGAGLDDRIKWIIDDLADVFQAADVAGLMNDFGKLTGRNDPFLHFYESFLAAYNPAKRKARGVWYTPEPVVNFIVRAVDRVLRSEFGLEDGLADTSKVVIDWDTGQTDKKGKPLSIRKEVHRVQILDPATGTGTFLAEVVKQIAPRVKDVAEGMWSAYVERDLIPRLHGFEILMASYAMCHMKLELILKEMGYRPTAAPPRLSVYLTNSLEEGEPADQTLPFAQWLSNEVKQANAIKRDMPIMCVIGNPPYNKSSTNTGVWIKNKIRAYKEGLSEKKLNLDDDYIKFLRFAESLIEKNDSGIVAMITNNSFLDGVTHRQMRKHLRQTFDKIYILNLHGDIRSESSESGKDENVFDITQGVAIVVMSARKVQRDRLAEVLYGEISGERAHKYRGLEDSALGDGFSAIGAEAPLFLFKPRNADGKIAYDDGFPVNGLFLSYSSGIQTKRDGICVSEGKEALISVIEDFKRLDEAEIRSKFGLPPDGRDWSIRSAKEDVLNGNGNIVPFLYKPFDIRYLYYSGKTKGFVSYPRREIMSHIVGRSNISLIVNRQTVRDYFSFAGVSNVACNHGTFYLGNRGQDYCMPLYLYPSGQDLDKTRRVNFDPKIFEKIKRLAANPGRGAPDEVQVFDYVYGVLHCPAYREAYAEFLRRDFPRIPWPASPAEFWDVAEKGGQLRRLHLMEPQAVGPAPYPFRGEGDGMVGDVRFDDGKVRINKTQFFADVPDSAWSFFIGGYQPAQKWLKDRKGRALSFDTIKHYQRIIKVLCETRRIMETIAMTLGGDKEDS
ncbi:type ISP restriction/modification enzyme [Oleispirillum naphthae]|uniref:type ISP restriction/modification enzyme n=1 Tax=Oleispirillum naphthae TaxID=2838853 RepID=UPI00308246AB